MRYKGSFFRASAAGGNGGQSKVTTPTAQVVSTSATPESVASDVPTNSVEPTPSSEEVTSLVDTTAETTTDPDHHHHYPLHPTTYTYLGYPYPTYVVEQESSDVPVLAKALSDDLEAQKQQRRFILTWVFMVLAGLVLYNMVAKKV